MITAEHLNELADRCDEPAIAARFRQAADAIEALQADLKANAAMLARQTDLAREAEAERDALAAQLAGWTETAAWHAGNEQF